MIVRDEEWVSVPDEGDLLECRTMARLAWKVGDGQHALTRVHDRSAQATRDGIYLPRYPLARWFVDNWWSLLYEPWSFRETIPGPGVTRSPEVQAWMRRHCMRTATAGYASPYACIFSQGDEIAIAGRGDPHDRYVHTPVELTETFDARGDREALRSSLAGFIQGVVTRIEGFPDTRATALQADWSALCATSPAEAEFCRAAGRLGLDPYDTTTWPPGLADWLERTAPGQLDEDLMADLLEAPGPASDKVKQHAAIVRVIAALGLGAATDPTTRSIASVAAHEDGYALANMLRGHLSLAADQPLEDVREAASKVVGRALVIDNDAALPDGRVLAVAGWDRQRGTPVVATRRSTSRASTRFLAGRGLYLTLCETTRGPRLVTDARTWLQRASRAFAAELLAPRAGVRQRYREAEAQHGCDAAEVLVATHYAVSEHTIRHQLEDSNWDGN